MWLLIKGLTGLYRQHPWQTAILLISITLGTALLTGVLILNQETRHQQQQNQQWLSAQPAAFIIAKPGHTLQQQQFVQLRRQGFHDLAPIVEGELSLANQQTLLVAGIEPLSLLGVANHFSQARDHINWRQFILPPYQIWLSPALAQSINVEQGATLSLADSQRSAPVNIIASLPLGQRAWVDIGYAQQLLHKNGELSRIAVLRHAANHLPTLRAALPDSLQLITSEQLRAPALNEALQLNLLAMAALAFVVATFLGFSAISLGIHQRRFWFGQLRLCGVSRQQLYILTGLELLILTTFSTLLGAVLGFALAHALLPALTQTLANIYEQYLVNQLPWRWLWLGYATLSSCVGLTLALVTQLLPLLRQPILKLYHHTSSVQTPMRWYLPLTIGCWAVAGILSFSEQLVAIYLQLALTLLAGALTMPLVFRLLLHLLTKITPQRWLPLHWLIGNSRLLLRPAGIALAALMLALMTNVGMHLMINSFRTATMNWLDQRLVGTLFVHGPGSTLKTINGWLEDHSPYPTSLRWQHHLRYQQQRSEWTSISPRARYLQRLPLASPQPQNKANWTVFKQHQGVLINEQAQHQYGFHIGDTVTVANRRLSIVAIYHDYGNPLPQFMVPTSLFQQLFASVQPSGLAIEVPVEERTALSHQLQHRFALDPSQLVIQQEVRNHVANIFDQTFQVTRALTSLTLLIAGIGIFCSASILEHQQRRQFALLRTLGWTRWQCLLMATLRWLLLTLLALLMAWPMGIMLADLLVGRVNPAAFGWSYHLQLAGNQWFPLFAICLGSIGLATVLPLWRDRRRPLATLLQEHDA